MKLTEGERVTIALGIIVALMFVIGMAQDVDAQKTRQQEGTLYLDKYPNPWPAMDYYKEKYDRAKASQMLGWIPEPLPMYRLDAIKSVQCDSWHPIKGQIPFPTALFMSLAISEAEPHHITVTNYGHTGFIGYLNIPCNEATLGMYDVYFSLWNQPTVWRTDFIEEPERIHMKVEVTP